MLGAHLSPASDTRLSAMMRDGAPPETSPLSAVLPAGDGQLPLLLKMPPMPTPDRKKMRSESLVGVLVVIGTIAGCATTGHISAHLLDAENRQDVALAFLGLVYAQAGLALLCLAGLLCFDWSGAIERSPETQLPVPPEVAVRLEAGQSLAGMANIEDSVHGSYCVRCCVWRPPPLAGQLARQRAVAAGGPAVCRPCRACWLAPGSPAKRAHHCQICQRCVPDFDHHCGVFGRCIAGAGWGANWGLFKAILGLGSTGLATAGLAGLAGLHARFGWAGGGYWGAGFGLLWLCGAQPMIKCGLTNLRVLCSCGGRPRPAAQLDTLMPGQQPPGQQPVAVAAGGGGGTAGVAVPTSTTQAAVVSMGV
eukprot:SAG22_NODE_4284_length_1317_cov_1.672414_1_plen_364_part_00